MLALDPSFAKPKNFPCIAGAVHTYRRAVSLLPQGGFPVSVHFCRSQSEIAAICAARRYQLGIPSRAMDELAGYANG